MRTVCLSCLPLLATLSLLDPATTAPSRSKAFAAAPIVARADTFIIRSANPERQVPFVLQGSGDVVVLFGNGRSTSTADGGVELRGTTPAMIVIRDGASETRVGALAEGEGLEIELPSSSVREARASVGGEQFAIVRTADGETVISSGVGLHRSRRGTGRAPSRSAADTAGR